MQSRSANATEALCNLCWVVSAKVNILSPRAPNHTPLPKNTAQLENPRSQLTSTLTVEINLVLLVYASLRTPFSGWLLDFGILLQPFPSNATPINHHWWAEWAQFPHLHSRPQRVGQTSNHSPRRTFWGFSDKFPGATQNPDFGAGKYFLSATALQLQQQGDRGSYSFSLIVDHFLQKETLFTENSACPWPKGD